MKPGVQWLRRSVQLAVLAASVLIAVLVEYRVLLARNQIETVRTQETKSFPRTIILAVDRAIGEPMAGDEATTKNKALAETLGKVQGNHWSAKVFGVTWTDPLAAFESMTAGRRITLTLLAGLLLPIVLTLVFGRVFCSWICPAGLLFDLTDRIRSWLPMAKQRPHDAHFWRGNKYVLLVGGLMVSLVVGAPVLGYFYPPALIGREIGHVVQNFFEELVNDPAGAGGFVLTGAALFLGILVFVEVFVSRRMWCRYFCPGGAIYSLLGMKRAVRLWNDTAVCTNCTECVTACPMGLNPMQNRFGPECDLCLECKTACQPGAIRLLPPVSRRESTEEVKKGKAA